MHPSQEPANANRDKGAGVMFRANDIDGELLGRLTNDDLKDIGTDKIDPMRYTPKTIGDLQIHLSGLHPNMTVEVEPDVPLAVKTVADLRTLTAWPRGLVLIVPRDRGRPESVVKVQRRELR